ncbi:MULTISPECIES: ATP-binding protein [Niastella]|uniref:histidine kinase n=1 Tax=Niastella soli TaxID=2821487 RepID=A0ABS3Z2A4_9BACT|nr:ATP-binding protein [Niastella soli]MBO9204288.1 PAS domain-containing protein [Niastella soli]
MYNEDHKNISAQCLNPSEYKDLLQATIDSSLDIIQLFKAVRNEEGRIIDFVWLLNNKKAIEQNGDVTGRSLLQQHPGVVEAGIFEKMVKVTETGKPSEEEMYYNYEQFDGWFYQAVVRSGDGVVLTTRDITKQKNAEAEIMKSRDLLLAMMDAPNIGIGVFKVVRNNHGKIIDFIFDFVNKRTLEAFGGNDPTGTLLSSYGSDGIEQLQYFKEVIETGNNNSYTRKAESGIVEGWFLFSNAPIGNDRLIQVWEDITDLKKAEQEIKATSNLLQSVLNVSLSGISYYCPVFNEENKIIDFEWVLTNNRANHYGGDRSLIGKRWMEEYPGIKECGVLDKMIAVVEKGEIQDWEFPYTLDGSHQWIRLTGVKLGNGLVTSSEDITARKLAEKEILDLKDEIASNATNKYYSIFNSINEGFCIYELVYNNEKADDLRWVEVNPAFEKQTGLKDTVGKLASEVMPGTETYWFEAYDKAAKTGEAVHFENWHEPTGRWYYTFASRIGGANSRQVAVLFSDITKRKQQEQRQQFLLNFSDTLRTIADPIETQRAAMRMLGEHLKVSRTFYYSLVQENDNWTYIIDDDWHADPTQPTFSGRFLSTDFGAHTFTRLPLGEAYICPNSHQLDITPTELQHYLDLQIIGWIAYPIIRQGIYEGGVCIHSPVARNWTEEEITLTAEVAERTWEAVERANAEEALRKSEIKLKELLQIREDFIGVASHELKTPVTSIKVYAEVVQEKLEKREWVEEGELMKRLNTQIDRLNKLINDLLNTTKISAGKLHFCFGPTDLNKVIQERLEEVKRTTKHNFVIELGDLPVVTSDQERIGQVITNLLTNAIKYSPITTTVTIKSSLAGDSIQVSVLDKGYGISPNDQLKIFDRFYRVTENNMDTFPGMGLGLYISSQIIQQHGGTLTVVSEPGNGSVFTFTIPIKSLRSD